MTSVPPIRRHILTIALEDYFQVGAFNQFVQQNQWYRFETRLEANTARTLELLARTGSTATFLVLGWVARRFPELVRRVADAGHEIAVKGYYHRGISDMTPEEFEADTQRARAAAESASGQSVFGYRVADGWLGSNDLWVLDVLARLGFGYDSSIAPLRGEFARDPLRNILHTHPAADRTIWEVPISTARMFGVRVPVAGGNYLRQLPGWVTRRAIADWDRTQAAPLVSYFHVWELDPEQPRLSVGSWLTRIRHYRNLERMEARLAAMLETYNFTSAASYLKLSSSVPDLSISPTPWPHQDSYRMAGLEEALLNHADRTSITIVIPCFNEEEGLPYLAKTLHRVGEALAPKYSVHFILVDDGSSDRTWEGLTALFADSVQVDLLRHAANRGVAAAILTGMRHTKSEVICSMDSDCSYDPLELANMIPLLVPGVDLVTASPYHPQGQVRNVPAWRLTLSRGAAWLYRRVLRVKLSTYTSCFRVYRRGTVAGLEVTNGRYLGVAELIGRLDFAGGTVVEYPTTLEIRMLGRSKMKTARTIVGHLGLMSRLAIGRMARWWRKPSIHGVAEVARLPRTSIDADGKRNSGEFRYEKTR
jgi:polysaccharide deacetylase family protein (PEP-CTERM system associated)